MSKERKPELELFAKNFSTEFERWKKDTHGSQEQFGKLVLSNRKSVGEWMHAQSKPHPETIQRICEVLNVSEDDLFQAKSLQDAYVYDLDFTKAMHERFQSACEYIGLNHDFMKFLKTMINDELFPVHYPITLHDGYLEPDENGIPTEDYYYRKPTYEAFECEVQNEYQRKTPEGKTVNLFPPDYAFMKEVQDQVIDFIQYLYFKRQNEMQSIVDSINAECVRIGKDGQTSLAHMAKHKIIERDRLSEYNSTEFFNEVMKNGKHNEKK